MPTEIRFPTHRPLWYQFPSWKAVDNGVMRSICSYPRRHGKDFEHLCQAARDAIIRKGTYYYVFPTRKWAKRAIWDTIVEINGESKFLIDHIFPPEIVKRKNETDLFLELYSGSMFFMGGTDNLDFVGQGGQGYTLSEFSLHKPEVTALLAPIIRQSQAYFRVNGTLRGKNNPLYEMLMNNKDSPKWFTTWLKPEQTKLYYWVSDEMNINPELQALAGKINPLTGKEYVNCQGKPFENIQDDIDSGMMSFVYARQEYLNDVVSHISGGYYGYEIKDMEKRNGVRPLNPKQELVYTFWDLGGSNKDNDATAIVFAHVDVLGKTAKIVDYYENTGHLRGHYWDIVNGKGYDYGGHYYPHDGKKTDPWTGETSADTAYREHGAEIRFVPKSQRIINDIEIGRRQFRNLTFSNSPDVEKLLDHVANYHEKDATGQPCHQNNCALCHGASHGADSLRTLYMAMHHNIVTPYLDTGRDVYIPYEAPEEEWFAV